MSDTPAMPPVVRECSLDECPIGLFMYSDELCLKTEYGNNEGRIDAYIVSTGEFFWGSAPQTIASQRRQMVLPIDADELRSRPTREEFEAMKLQCLGAIAERDRANEQLAASEAEVERYRGLYVAQLNATGELSDLFVKKCEELKASEAERERLMAWLDDHCHHTDCDYRLARKSPEVAPIWRLRSAAQAVCDELARCSVISTDSRMDEKIHRLCAALAGKAPTDDGR